MPTPFPISGYVLAGGRSSRMGRDKAHISLAGKPLIAYAVAKLRRVCAEVSILSSDADLAAFAPLVSDVHSSCGPIGGIEAALLHSAHDWNLFLPVDMPFLPAAVLCNWIFGAGSGFNPERAGVHILNADGRHQPGVCLIHRALAPLVTSAIEREEFALISLFEEVGREAGGNFSSSPLGSMRSQSLAGDGGERLTAAQQSHPELWFLNVNTKEDLALAELHSELLDG